MDDNNNVISMSDRELLTYLTDLEEDTREQTIDSKKMLEKVNTIKRQLEYRNNLDAKIRRKLNDILKML